MEKVREWYEVENGPDSELEVRHQMQRDVGQRIGARTMRCFDVSEKVEVCLWATSLRNESRRLCAMADDLFAHDTTHVAYQT